MTEDNFKFFEQTQAVFRQIENILQQNVLLSDTLWRDVEEKLVAADIGPGASRWTIQRLQQRAKEEQISSGLQAYVALRQELTYLLRKPSKGKLPTLHFSKQSPVTVILVMGDKGSGKTASSAKLAYRLSSEGLKVLLVATGTFHSGSINLLKSWGEQINVSVMHQNNDSTPATVMNDAFQSALAYGYDVVIVDTAGYPTTAEKRQEELKNVIDIVQKIIPDAPHELLVVVDATNGQAIVSQARTFAEYTGLTGVILSKVDSTARGGCAFAITDDLEVPIKFFGTGKKVEQLVPFDPERFVATLFEKE